MQRIVAAGLPKKQRPIAGKEPDGQQKVRIDKKPDAPRWLFSFRFWRQIEFFGLDRTPATWLVSVLDRLQQLSSKNVGDFIVDSAERDGWRYHKIDWEQPSIPVQREDLVWIDPLYLNNEDEFPLYQFQVSQTLGRVIGFWDENRYFNIVFLDPFHNMQPTKRTGYRVDPCGPLEEVASECADNGCDKGKRLTGFNDCKKQLQAFNVLMVKVGDPMKLKAADELIETGVVKSHSEIFEYGLAKALEDFGV
jgi:hypothetical protein